MIRLVDLVALAGPCPIGPANLSVPRGGYAILTGPSGGGKTTLLEAIAGLRPVIGGRVELRGADATRVAPAGRGVGLAPQDAVLFGRMTVAENLIFPLTIRTAGATAKVRRAGELAAQLGLTQLLGRRANRLSGGEAARVALGRAAAHRPDILLLDEPFAALDGDSHNLAQRAVNAWRAEWGCAVLHVTHHVAGPLPPDAVELTMAGATAGKSSIQAPSNPSPWPPPRNGEGGYRARAD